MAINQINELQLIIEDQNRQIAELAKKLGTALGQNNDLRGLYSEQRQRELTLLAQLHDETVRANKAEKSNKSSELRKARHEQEERANAAEGKAAQMEEENLDLQIKLQDGIKAKNDLIKQLQQVVKLTTGDGKVLDARTSRKLLENKNKRIAQETKRADVAEALVVAQQEEIEYHLNSISNIFKKLQKAEAQGWVSDIRLIFEGFGIDIGVNLDKGERQDLYMAVKKAKKLDDSSKEKDQKRKATEGYDARIKQIVEKIRETRSTEFGKQAVTEEGVISLIDQTMDKPSLARAFTKSSTPVKLALIATVVVVIGVVLVSALVPSLNKADQESQRADNANANADLQARIANLEAQYGEAIATILSSYGVVNDNQDIAALLQENVTKDNIEEFEIITQATELANNLVALNGSEEISEESEVGQNVKAYLEAKQNGDTDAAQGYLTALTNQMNEIKAAANNSSSAVNGILQGLGIQSIDDLDEYLNWQEIKNSPVLDIPVDPEDIAEYNDSLVSQGAMFGGGVIDVKFVRYEKETGKVTIFADCQSKYGTDYVNVITFNTDKNQNNMSFAGVMNTVQELANSGKLTSNAALADTVIEDGNGNTAYTVVSSAYDRKTDSTTVTTHLLVLTADNNYRDFVETTTYEGRLDSNELTEAKETNADRTMMKANKAMNLNLNRFAETDLGAETDFEIDE